MKKKQFLFLFISIWGVLVAGAADRTWTGSALDSNWFNSANWTPSDNYPQVGEGVSITNTPRAAVMTNSSAALSFLTISNATLVVSNWTTRVQATMVTIRSNGVITLPSAFATGDSSNRVYLVCSNLTIETGGAINVDGKGYLVTQGPSPGSQSGSNNNGGGGNGGRGGDEAGGAGGAETGDASAPEGPGSGGGRWTSSPYPTPNGCGGGVVRIVATNVVVNGIITANGTVGEPYDGGGAGGSIFITCTNFSGSNGVIRANGGNGGYYYGGGGGGGGRIAVIYGQLGASLTVFFSTIPGPLYTENPAGMGTVYFPDTAMITADSVGHYFDQVRLIIPGWNSWAVGSLTVVSNAVCLGETNFTLIVTNDLVVASNGWLTVGGKAYSDRVSLRSGGGSGINPLVQVGSNLVVQGGTLTVGGLGQDSLTRVTVGGNLFLTNAGSGLAGRMYVMGGFTNATSVTNGGWIEVAGDLTIASNSWLQPVSQPTNGGSIRVSVQNVHIQPGGGIDANSLGFRGYLSVSYGPGAGLSSGSRGSGAGYGGAGGPGITTAGGPAYGQTNRPIHPGSAGAWGFAGGPGYGHGGGLIWLDAAAVTVDGTLSANGRSSQSSYGGGGSGGGIFILCDSFEGSSTGLISATGGQGGSTLGGGGGGGRIAVAIAMSAADRAKLIAGQTVDGLFSYASHGPFLGTVSVTNGAAGYAPGLPGSQVYLTTLGNTFVLQVVGSPTNYGTPIPYGLGSHIGIVSNSWLTNSVTSPTDNTGTQRWSCIGWTLKTDVGVAVTNGTNWQAVFQMTTNLTLTWNWTNEFLMTVNAGPNGSVATGYYSGWYTNLTAVGPISATPSGGYSFVEWTGDVSPSNRTSVNPLTVTMTQARVFQAQFGSIAGESKQWGGTGNWLTHGNWTPGGVPGPKDAATIGSGTVRVDMPQSVASLALNNGAGIIFSNWTTAVRVTDEVLIRSNATISVAGSFTESQMSNRVWIICRDLTVEGGGAINVDANGYFTHTGPGKGGGSGSNGGSGGGHGGKGGASFVAVGGPIYGQTNAPQTPGSGGGGTYDNGGGNGGGVIWIDASGTVRIDGTITANGQMGGTYNGGGAGGSIFIISLIFNGGSNAIIRANGGDRGSGYTSLGGGGGGRISVWSGPIPPSSRAILLEGGEAPRLFYTNRCDLYYGVMSVTNGASYAAGPLPEAGSFQCVLARPPSGIVLTVR